MFILVAIFLIDKLGRKPLLFVSTIGMTVCLFGLSLSLAFFGHEKAGIIMAIISVCGNVAFFSIGLGPICWVVSSEIFPLRLRAQASALGAVGSRVSSGVLSMSFLSVTRAITVAGTFFVFGIISCSAVAFVYYCVPETKGKTLEEIEKVFQDEGDGEWQRNEVEMGDHPGPGEQDLQLLTKQRGEILLCDVISCRKPPIRVIKILAEVDLNVHMY
ncbi:probable polyol transporter 4 [Neltuma alba]|uniref:probable polyol transporter 4 n=1 Tax=Neltuma alba TaxID=207710 RepID=UPI0010A4B73F|nr:probable polyol transporter 4 [Prosopis alba]